MPDKDESDKFFEGTSLSDDQLSAREKKESLHEFQDSEEEIIELTDPDNTPAVDSEEEVIEPADFLDELSVDEPKFSGKADDDALSFEEEDDIIELTDTAENPALSEQSEGETLSSNNSLLSDDKDLFVFTDSEDEAVIADDDILSDTVFADEPFSGNSQPVGKDMTMFTEEEEKPASQDISMFDDTVFANEPSGNDDEELAVLTEIDENPQQEDNQIFDGTVFSDEPLQNADDELAVLTELEDTPAGTEITTDDRDTFFDAPTEGDNSDMVLFEETERDMPSSETTFMDADDSGPSEKTQLEIESIAEKDFADSLGMNLEPSIDMPNEAEGGGNVQLTIEPESDVFTPETDQFSREELKSFQLDTPEIDQNGAAVSSEPVSIPPDQLEAAVENVIRKMFGSRIDNLIIEAIEKAVQSDIDRIKKELIMGSSVDS